MLRVHKDRVLLLLLPLLPACQDPTSRIGVAPTTETTGLTGSTDSPSDTGTDTGTTRTTPEDTATETDTGSAPSAGPRGLLLAQSWDHESLPMGAGAGNYRAIFLQESMYTILPEIRAANPEAALFAYQKVGGMRADGGAHPSSGIRVDEAVEAWFLHDADGNRLVYCDYDGVWAANIGHPGYQAAWLEAVRDRVVADGFDGVMMDDTNTFPGHCLGSHGTPIAEYPTDASYGDAVVEFMSAVGPGLKNAGLLVAPNIAMNPWDEVMLAQAVAMLPNVTHWGREYWMRWDDSENFRGDQWESTLDTMRIAQDAGASYFGLTYGPGVEGATEGQLYGRASWLLVWDGRSESAWGYWGDGEDPWSESWGPDIGLPDREARQVGGAWVREYTGGIAVVNPSEEDDLTVPLGGRYLDPDSGPVESVTLDRGHARVLVRP